VVLPALVEKIGKQLLLPGTGTNDLDKANRITRPKGADLHILSLGTQRSRLSSGNSCWSVGGKALSIAPGSRL
jgi:hypothetical protein